MNHTGEATGLDATIIVDFRSLVPLISSWIMSEHTLHLNTRKAHQGQSTCLSHQTFEFLVHAHQLLPLIISSTEPSTVYCVRSLCYHWVLFTGDQQSSLTTACLQYSVLTVLASVSGRLPVGTNFSHPPSPMALVSLLAWCLQLTTPPPQPFDQMQIVHWFTSLQLY